MNDTDIRNSLINVLRDIQTQGGRACPTEFSGDLLPMRNLDGFDSLVALDVSLALSESLGQEVPIDVKLFQDGARSRSINEIVTMLTEIIHPKEQKKHA